jgi:hypothetical protein
MVNCMGSLRRKIPRFLDFFPAVDELARQTWLGQDGGDGRLGYWAAMVRTPVAGMLVLMGWPALMVAVGWAVRNAVAVV